MREKETIAGAFEWTNIRNAKDDDYQFIEKAFNIEEVDIEYCKGKMRKPRIKKSGKVIFIFYRIPKSLDLLNIGYEEVAFFAGEKFVVTITPRQILFLDNLFASLKKEINYALPKSRQRMDISTPERLVFYILREFVMSLTPLLQEIGKKIEYLDSHFHSLDSSTAVYSIANSRKSINFLLSILRPELKIFDNLQKLYPNVEKSPCH